MAASGGARPISLSNLQSAGGGGGGEGVFGSMEGVGSGSSSVAGGSVRDGNQGEEHALLPSLIGASPRKKAKTQKRKAAMSGEELELLEMGREQFTSLDADRQWDLFSELLAHV
ncbi:hypothetical protein BT69DRAFT_101887, partial [Atractiella rhizophila]